MSINREETNIVVVDDEKSILDSLGRILRREGYNVITFSNPKDALDVLRKKNISLLITDLWMPDVSGLELMKLSKKLSPETEVILMTAYGSVELQLKLLKKEHTILSQNPLKKPLC